jgi:hypothetical protein
MVSLDVGAGSKKVCDVTFDMNSDVNPTVVCDA